MSSPQERAQEQEREGQGQAHEHEQQQDRDRDRTRLDTILRTYTAREVEVARESIARYPDSPADAYLTVKSQTGKPMRECIDLVRAVLEMDAFGKAEAKATAIESGWVMADLAPGIQQAAESLAEAGRLSPEQMEEAARVLGRAGCAGAAAAAFEHPIVQEGMKLREDGPARRVLGRGLAEIEKARAEREYGTEVEWHVHGTPNAPRRICSQCGRSFKAPACGPTHAMIAAERYGPSPSTGHHDTAVEAFGTVGRTASGEWTGFESVPQIAVNPYPHEGGCSECSARGICNHCGERTGPYPCTNGRCDRCHRDVCAPGGEGEPGHGYGLSGVLHYGDVRKGNKRGSGANFFLQAQNTPSMGPDEVYATTSSLLSLPLRQTAQRAVNEFLGSGTHRTTALRGFLRFLTQEDLTTLLAECCTSIDGEHLQHVMRMLGPDDLRELAWAAQEEVSGRMVQEGRESEGEENAQERIEGIIQAIEDPSLEALRQTLIEREMVVAGGEEESRSGSEPVADPIADPATAPATDPDPELPLRGFPLRPLAPHEHREPVEWSENGNPLLEKDVQLALDLLDSAASGISKEGLALSLERRTGWNSIYAGEVATEAWMRYYGQEKVK